MVPPIAYRYSYHETKDKEYTLAVVALASLLCVLLLAILKAYINKCTVFKYFKTAVYYVIIAVLVSGVSYVVGNLVARLLEEPGWFATSSSGGMPCVPRVTSSYLESF
ncbi:putative Ccc1 family protein [Helianthus annuus]|nr:putative Ccc1 family protein [Helianthus annuus]